MARKKLHKEQEKVNTTLTLEKKVGIWLRGKFNVAGFIQELVKKSYELDKKCNIKK